MDTLVLAQAGADTAPTSPVARDKFAAQLVPTAISRVAPAQYRIRATVVFSPVPALSNPGPLNAWPSWIAERFARGNIQVLVRQAMTDGEGNALAEQAVNAFSDAYKKIDANPDEALKQLTNIWQTWFPDVIGLRELLSGAAQKTAADSKQMFQQDSNGNIDSTPDVISVPRAELARQTTLERARDLIESLAAAQSASERENYNKQRQVREKARPGAAKRPWSKVPIGAERTRILRDLLGDLSKRPVAELRLANVLETSRLQQAALAAEKKSTDLTLSNWRKELAAAAGSEEPETYEPFKWEERERPDQWFKDLKVYLQDERRWLELTLALQLEDQREAARQYAKSCQDCAEACSAATIQLANYLKTLTSQRVAHRASHIESTAQSVMGTAADDAAVKDAAAQNASTLQDHGKELPRDLFVSQLRWHALQGMPALMRAMHLVLDIEFTVHDTDFSGLDAMLPANQGLAEPALFVEFAIKATDESGQDCVHQTLWTLTKLRLPTDEDKEGHCWPATTEEWALRRALSEKTPNWLTIAPETTGFLDQVDAVIDLDAPLSVNGGSFKRYDIFSVDVTIASEAEQRRQAAETQVKESRTAMPEAEQVSASETSTLRTGGLQIVDRWRQGAVIDEIFTSCKSQSSSGRRVDANDLLIGYRFDVGLPQLGGSDRRWASLSERIVHYEHSNDEGLANLNMIANAFSPPGGDDVRAVDGATVAMGTRLVRNSQGGVAQGGKETAFAEQLVAVWDGDPIGMRTGGFESHADAVDLPVTRILSLPNRGTSRAHRLRFGGAYALGARSVLVGGVCAPLDRAKHLYDHGLKRGMAYPSSAAELQRYLRQERIGPPIVAVEDSVLLDEFRSQRKGIDGKEMVVRSLPEGAGPNEDSGWRFQPGETSRMLFAPLVDLDFAVMHSVFDAAASHLTGKPPGGLQDVDYDSDWGGFPLFDPREPPEPTAIRGKYRHYEKYDKNGTELKQKVTPGGFAVHKKRTGSGQREHEYYPDPAARELVIALRYPDQKDRYLSGPAIRVPLYDPRIKGAPPTTPGYPDARPIRIRVKATSSTAVPTLTSYDDLESRAAEAGGRVKTFEKVGDAQPLVTVTLYLNPGEDFEVETWCMPTEEHLRAWFDLPEAIALIMNSAADNRAVQCCQAVSDPPAEKSDKQILRRGEASIPWTAVKSAASAVYKTLLSRPLPDIASIRRFRAIHAFGLPKDEPQGKDIKLLRLSAATRKKWLERGEGPSEDEDGGSQVVALGIAAFDPDTTETLELHAEAPMPFGGAFDNLELGRSFDRRARGEWPRTQPGPDGQPEPVKASQRRPTVEGEMSYMSELFGFDVTRDGKAELRRGRGMVARWQIERTQTLPADLADLTRQGKQSNDGDKQQEEAHRTSRSVLEGIFPDTFARRVTLWLAATSRTARQIPDRSSYPTPAEKAIDEERLFRKSVATDIILPATERPSALTPKSLLPSYVWTGGGNTRSRKTKVRIRLRRPWWTSGEDERLAVVVWPPNLMAATGTGSEEWKNSELEQGIIERKTPMARKEGPREIDLHRFADPGKTAQWREGFFTDADLGLGGTYVTRWGADPIFASEEMAWLIDAAAFRDISASDGDFAEPIDLIKTDGGDLAALWPKDLLHKPRFVENALMPIPDADDNNDTQKDETGKDAANAEKSKLTPEFMLVSLVTYAPRFDPDFEHWYVDVDLDVGPARDPFIRFGLVRFQPHAKRHLQVSQPVAEWVQVVGYLRQVTVSRVPDGGRAYVSVRVGPTTAVDAGKYPATQDTDTAPGETPLMRVTLIECSRSPHGQILERVARLDEAELKDDALGGRIDKDRGGLVIKTCQVNTGASLLLDLKLPIPASGEAQRLQYAVLVEELTMTPRSTYSNEPIRKDADILEGERYIESGPRFAVRVELDPPQILPD